MEVSFGEMLLVLLIAFLVLGPKELAIQANKLGRFMGRMKHQWNNFRVMAEEQLLKDEIKIETAKKEEGPSGHA